MSGEEDDSCFSAPAAVVAHGTLESNRSQQIRNIEMLEWYRVSVTNLTNEN